MLKIAPCGTIDINSPDWLKLSDLSGEMNFYADEIIDAKGIESSSFTASLPMQAISGNLKDLIDRTVNEMRDAENELFSRIIRENVLPKCLTEIGMIAFWNSYGQIIRKPYDENRFAGAASIYSQPDDEFTSSEYSTIIYRGVPLYRITRICSRTEYKWEIENL